jgi:dUTP pyrophosphatase
MEKVVKIKKVSLNAEIPSYAYDTDVGFDLRANVSGKLFPGEQKEFKTGLIFEIPEGHVGLIRDRVGIVTKMGVHTCAGTFDPGFRGEVSIFLVNLSEETRYIEEGMKIAQMIFLPVIKPKIIEVKKNTKTKRGEKSFGSTDIKELKNLNKKIKSKKVSKKKPVRKISKKK